MRFASALVFTLCASCAAPPARSPDPTGANAPPSSPPAAAPKRATPANALLSLSKRDHTLAIVDPVSLDVVARVPVGDDPHEVIATADGATAYVSNYGGGSLHTLAVVDLTGQAALPAVDLGALRGPHGLVAQGGKIWFTVEGSKAVGSYDPAAKKIDWVLGTGQDRTHMLFVWPDLKRVVTTNVSSGTMSILEKSAGRHGPPGGPPGGGPPGGPGGGGPPGGPGGGPPGGGRMGPPGGDWDETLVRVGESSEGFDVSPDGKEAWAANAREGTVSIVDVASKTLKATLKADVRGANRLKFTPDGTRVLVSMLGGGDVVVLDVATHAEVKRIPVGRGASGIVMQPDGARAYVACTPDDYVAVIDLKTLAVVGHVASGGEPDGLAWAVKR